VSIEQVLTWNPDVILALDPAFYRSVATDPLWASMKAVHYLSYARAQRVLPNLHFQLGDAGLLPFAQGAFAASLSQLVLTFVTDPRQVAAEMVRVTRPGGVVASAVWDFCGGLVYQRILWDTAAALDPQASRTRDRLFSNPLSTPDGLKGLWQTAGLVDIEVGSLTIRMNYANFDDYWEPLLGGQGPVGTFAAGLPEDARRQLQTAVRAAFSKRPTRRTSFAYSHRMGRPRRCRSHCLMEWCPVWSCPAHAT
jgi:SAM-dependent methyltransferase